MYTQVPWEEVQAKKREKSEANQTAPTMPEPVMEPRILKTDFSFTDKNALIRKSVITNFSLTDNSEWNLNIFSSVDNDDAQVYGETDQVSSVF